MPRFARAALVGLCFALFSVGSGVLGFLILPLVRLLSAADAADDRCRRVISASLRRFLWTMRVPGLFRVTTKGAVDSRPGGAFVLIANHPTLLDTVVLLALVPGVQAIVKHTWAGTPLIGSVVRRSGYLRALDPAADPAGATPVLDQMVDRLRAGESLLVFPEGTRSPDGGIHRFRRGGLEAARLARVPVWPVLLTLNVTPSLSHEQWWQVQERCIEMTIAFQEPFEVPMDASTLRLTRQMGAAYKGAAAGADSAGGDTDPWKAPTDVSSFALR